MLIYLDTNIVIYLVERSADLSDSAWERLGRLKANGDTLVVSHLVRMEARVGPLARGDAQTVDEYDAFFTDPEVQVVELTRGEFDLATGIRARHRLGTLDALHLAAAVGAGCDVFLTNDSDLARFPDIQVEVLP